MLGMLTPQEIYAQFYANKPRSFDVKCLELAGHFLSDGAAEALKDALAHEIQDVVDDFVSELQARQSKRAEAA